jgi:hypothetical protein
MSAKNVVTAASSVECGKAPGHEGTVAVSQGQGPLTVSGARALVATDLIGASISGCKNQNVSSNNVPCSTVQSVSSISTCLTVGGKGVVIDAPLAGVTVGTPPGSPTAVDVKQSVLVAE